MGTWVSHYFPSTLSSKGWIGWKLTYQERIKFSSDIRQWDLTSCLLDVVLVFTRARTSALHGMAYGKPCSDLVSKLHQQCGTEYHRLELIRRGPYQFFETVESSPRFIWHLRLSHRDIGRNLDYFAAGHIFSASRTQIGSILVIEKTTFTIMFSEQVGLEILEDEDVLKMLHEFNRAKQQRFSNAMHRLDLPYRFKYLLTTPSRQADVVQTMRDNHPPNSEWWEDNCYNLFRQLCGIRGRR